MKAERKVKKPRERSRTAAREKCEEVQTSLSGSGRYLVDVLVSTSWNGLRLIRSFAKERRRGNCETLCPVKGAGCRWGRSRDAGNGRSNREAGGFIGEEWTDVGAYRSKVPWTNAVTVVWRWKKISA